MTRQRLLLSSLGMAMPSIAPRTDLHRGPAQLQEHRRLAKQHLTGSAEARLAPQTATSPASVATAHPTHPLVFAALRLHLRSQRSLTLPVRRLTHLTAHWPSWWLNQAVPLAARPLPPLLCLCDTIPSSASSFRTSLLVYHLFSLSPNVCSSYATSQKSALPETCDIM